MGKRKIKIHKLVLPFRYQTDTHLFFTDEGIILIPLRLVEEKCVYDIEEKLQSIIKNREMTKEVLKYLKEEFQDILKEYRIEWRQETIQEYFERKAVEKEMDLEEKQNLIDNES